MPRTPRAALALASALVWAGCLPTSSGGSDPDPVLILDEDAGAPDTGALDAGPLDADVPDADVPDTGALDVGAPDAPPGDAGDPPGCPTSGSPRGCPPGQVCDVTTTGNACFETCTPGQACGEGEVCSPVAREGGGFSGVFDCYPGAGGLAPGAACDPDGGAACRLDQTCAPDARGDDVCSAWCLPGTGDGCEAGQECVPSGIEGLGYCELEGACDGCVDGAACRPGTTNSACGSGGGACEVCAGEGVVCREGACVSPCDPGFNLCGGFCSPADDPERCGPGCATCVDRPNAVTTCQGGACAYPCEADAVPCASGCCRPQPVAAGWEHTCAVTQGGGVKCWGSNDEGQLGTGDTTPRGVPADVPNLPAPALGVVAGEDHTCMLSTTGGVYCWGDNTFGQLGDGTGVDSLVPVAVSGLTDVVELATYRNHTCALTASGGLSCWGQGSDGQLGDGTIASRASPVTPRGLGSNCVAVGAGDAHTCAACADANNSMTTYCWGSDSFEQLGNDVGGASTTPRATFGARDHPRGLCGGARHTCGVTLDGAIDCVGSNVDGQLGSPGSTARTWRRVAGYTGGGVQVACGGFRALALDDAGGVKLWGFGVDSVANRSPTDVPGLQFGVGYIDAGRSHMCASRTNGDVLCWGLNTSGQIGVASPAPLILDPTPVSL